ncbi:hypothetical protein CC86DRAFT_365141 [Ophiobolus disseminans]|uniref:Uncharacterized protein n=1 Tax=Ophiobolus disseminans TaxID=1469910 RepID=A0A6A7AKQ7_9PLEO|nr:hypothetical protein CC86DRAFT_365141 [Ophiobolus disseminans]
MVLHYTHKLMLTPQGLSFGLLEAAYQSGLSSNPWTIGNWEALKHLKSRLRSKDTKTEAKNNGGQRTWLLVVLLVVFAFLALFVGPASALTLIPQLGWWHRDDLIGPVKRDIGGRYQAPRFSVYVPTNLFPTEVDENHLPGSFCDDAAKDINGTCPSARIAEIQRSFTIPLPGINIPKVWNSTIALSEDENLPRRMLYLQSSGTGYTSNTFSYHKAAVTVPNYVLASFASLIRLPAFDNVGEYSYGGPFTLEIFANNAAPMAPLVGVYCNDSGSDVFLRDYNYDSDIPSELEDMRRTATFDLRSVWDEEDLKRSINGTQMVWTDLTNTTDTPVLLGLMRHNRNVSVCSVQASWTPTSNWVLSTSNSDLATNFTFDNPLESNLYSTYGYPYFRNAHRIHIHEKWANTLNAINGSVKVLDAVLQNGITTIKEASERKMSNATLVSADMNRYFAATISQIFAKSVANGLSRIGAQYAADRFNKRFSMNELTICNTKTRWCSAGPWIASGYMPLAVTANSSRYDVSNLFSIGWTSKTDTTPLMRSFPMPLDADEKWTRIHIPVRRYGYAYAFEGVTMYLSVALLLFHTAMVVIHVMYRVFIDRKSFQFGGSLGALLQLAMGDKAPSGGNMWTQRVAAVSSGGVVDPNKLRLEVIEVGDETVDKLQQIESEEVMKLVGAEQFDERGQGFASTRRHAMC